MRATVLQSEAELTGFLSEVLEHWHQLDRPLPWLLVAVGINGSIIGARYTKAAGGDLDCEMLTEPTSEHTMLLPINMMLVDATGEAGRVVINQAGITFH